MSEMTVDNNSRVKNEKLRFNSISGIRGIACLCIVCFHFFCLIVEDQGFSYDSVPFISSSKYFFAYSKNAVELFFMLSGFLIAWRYRESILEMSFVSYFKKHYKKLLLASVVVNTWALVNALIRNNIGLTEGLNEPTALRTILSILMINTGWFTSYSQTKLPINTTMWFIDVLLLCYLLYYIIRKIGKDNRVYIGLSVLMVCLGWICLEHSPKLPFLWSFDGRGYATFFLGVLLAEFQLRISDKQKILVSTIWGSFVLLFFIFHMVAGFENVFGEFGTKNYVRYFEFIAAPGMILSALNLKPIERVFSWQPLLWLGALSSTIYYIHNNCMEDYLIINAVAGNPLDLKSFPAFVVILVSMIPLAIISKKICKFL